ncbi:MAG: hypothetical protein RSB93_00235 [Rikenellaceae bacterium]
MGVVSRIRLGFAAVALLLLMAGATSYFEFYRLNQTIEVVTSERNQRNKLTEELLSNIYKQANVVSTYMLTDSLSAFEDDCKIRVGEITNTLNKIAQYENHKKELSDVEKSLSEYLSVVDVSFVEKIIALDGKYMWYSTYLMPAQQKLGSSVLSFLNASHKDLTSNALGQLNNIYRSDLKIFITLLACMFILFMFFALIKVFYLKPIINIKKGLEDYLDGERDYDVKDCGVDEVKQINILIEQIIQNNDSKGDDN